MTPAIILLSARISAVPTGLAPPTDSHPALRAGLLFGCPFRTGLGIGLLLSLCPLCPLWLRPARLPQDWCSQIRDLRGRGKAGIKGIDN